MLCISFRKKMSLAAFWSIFFKNSSGHPGGGKTARRNISPKGTPKQLKETGETAFSRKKKRLEDS
jgi:hypothetical protein